MIKRLMICMILVLLICAVPTQSVLAYPPDEDGDGWLELRTCVTTDDMIVGGFLIPAGSYSWGQAPYWFINALEADPDHPFFWPEEVLGPCPSASPTTVDVSFGQELDLWNSTCGMYFPQSPFQGTATLGPVATPEGVNAFRSACGLTVTDIDDEVIENPAAGLYYYYYELDEFHYDRWNEGQLGLFVYDTVAGMWNECSAQLIDVDLENDDFGRITCLASNLGPFVVGRK